MFQKTKLDFFISLIAFIFITITLGIIINVPPATGYELTIYDAYPPYFWLSLITSSACGIGILLHQAATRNRSSWWLVGLCAILMSNSVLLSLPYLHGYFFFPAGDAQSHIGMMLDIITTSHIDANNFYPIIHILGVNFCYITGINIGVLPTIFTILWDVVFLLGMYCLSKMITHDLKHSLLIVAFASPLIFSHMQVLIHPSMFSIFMIPLLLYFFHKYEAHDSRSIDLLCLLLIGVAIILSHPMTGIFIIAIVLCFAISNTLYNRWTHDRMAKSIMSDTSHTIIVVAALSSIWFIWYFPFISIQSNIQAVFEFLFFGNGVPLIEVQMMTLTEAGITPFQTIQLFIYSYGAIFILLAISSIAVMITFRNFLQKKTTRVVFSYSLQFILALGFSAFSLFGLTGEYSVVRISRFFLMMCPIVSGLVFYQYFVRLPNSNHTNKSIRNKLIIIIAVAIISVGALNTLNVYGSPRTVVANWQVTEMENTGHIWFSLHYDPTVSTSTITDIASFSRFEHFNFGYSTCPQQYRVKNPTLISSHFGYDQNSSISITLNSEDQYLITSQRGRLDPMIIPENIRYKAHIYDLNDFDKLANDEHAARTYSNGEFEIWRIYG